MPHNISSSSCLLIAVTVMLLSVFCYSPAHADSRVFSGVTTSIITNKSCSEKPENIEIVLVFDGEAGSASSGWFYGKDTSTAKFKRISPTRFEVIYAVTLFNKLPPSIMELSPTKNGFVAVVNNSIPEVKSIQGSLCSNEKMEITLKPLKESDDDLINSAKELFAADLFMLEGDNLFYKEKDYASVVNRGQKTFQIYKRIYGVFSIEAIKASGMITNALMKQERFDEALDIIAPYRKALPDEETLKDVEKSLLLLKKNQDDLFRSDPDKKSDADLEPLG